MRVMSYHAWFDDDVEKVLWEGHENNREIVFKHHNHGAMLINKEDVIALAKEFDLLVFEKKSRL